MNQEQESVQSNEKEQESVQSNETTADSRSREEELEAEVARLQGEVQELQNRLLRTTADFENFRRRSRQEKEEMGQFANMQMIQTLLPVLDNFQLALAAQTTDPESLKKGIEMVFRQFQSVLEQIGVKEIEAVGKPFDPNFHEAVMQVEADEQSGQVVEELRKGYLLLDKVIRPAMVKVAK